MRKYEVRNFLICETFKKQDGDYPKLNLLPLIKNNKYGQLFLGIEIIDDEFSKEDASAYLWRFSENGYIERAENTGDLSDLDFEETDYTLCTKIETKGLEETFGTDFRNYQEMLDLYSGRNGRIQRYVSPTPQLDRLKGRLQATYDRTKELIQQGKVTLTDRNTLTKIAALLASGTLAVSGIAGLFNYIESEKNNIVATFEPPVAMSDIIIQETAPKLEVETLIATELPNEYIEPQMSVEDVKTVELSENDKRYQTSSEAIFHSIDQAQNTNNKSNNMYEYLYKYSSTLNPTLATNDKGPFSSVEEMMDSYRNDQKRFAVYAKRFMAQMNLDFMKIQLAAEYGIDDFEAIRLTYEEKIGAYEVRVRSGGKDLETPGFGMMKTPVNAKIDKINRVLTGSRFSKVGLKYWENYFQVCEMENFTDYGINSGKYTLDEYNGELLEHLQVLSENIKELSPELENEHIQDDDYELI